MKDGKAVPSPSLTGALAVGVPGEVAGLIDAHKRFGTLPLAVLAAPAIRLATDGFAVDGAMGVAIERLAPTMKRFPDLAKIYLRAAKCQRRSADSANRLARLLRQSSRDEVFIREWQAIVDTIKRAGVMTPMI